MIWSHPHESQFYFWVAVVLVGLLFVACRFASRPIARTRSIIVLRAAVLGMLLLVLLNPVRIQNVKRAGPEPTAVFLVDASRSMSLESPISRLEAVDRLIRRADERLSADRRPAIQKYRFGRELTAIADNEKAGLATADETRLIGALEQLPGRFADALPFGVFVFSDGRSTEHDGLESTVKAYRALKVPIHVAPVGDEKISGDVAVQDIDAPRSARAGTRVPVRVTVRSRGFGGRRTELSIRAAADPRGRALATLPLTLAEGEQAHELVIETDQAKGALFAMVAPLAGEAIEANNRVPFQIAPRDDTLRVLYMEGTPNQEYRFLNDALQEDPSIQCVSLYVDNPYEVRPTLHRVNNRGLGFPTTRQELLDFDIVICSDIKRSAFTPQQLEWTVELVGKRGGGFAMVGGETSFGSGGWDQTVWDGLIPVDMRASGRSSGEYHIGQFGINVPSPVAEHPIWKIVDEPMRNRDVLSQMPRFRGTNLTERLKPAATVLGFSDRSLGGAGIVPIFSCQTFGRGRTFAMATDSTGGWGKDFERYWGVGDNRYFRKFWRNVVRWLAENRDGSSRRLSIETDKVVYRPGQPIKLTARAYDDELVETDRYQLVASLHSPIEVESETTGPAFTNLVPQLQDKTYRGELTAPTASEIREGPGSTVHPLRLDVAARDGGQETASSSLEIQVIDDPAEFRDPRPDRARLVELARSTGGQVIDDAEQLVALLGRDQNVSVEVFVRRSPVWDTPVLWFVVMGLLSAEWIVRRRMGLA
jgi:uncharacterized membrane protein